MGEVSGIWADCLDCAALSDIGLRRANNQDSYAVTLAADQSDFERRGHLFMVADGMGAHAAGELASKIATDVVSLSYRKLLDQSPPEALRRRCWTPTARSTPAAMPAASFAAWAPPPPCWSCCRPAAWWPTWATAAPIASAAGRSSN